jgi:hypothetical protein
MIMVVGMVLSLHYCSVLKCSEFGKGRLIVVPHSEGLDLYPSKWKITKDQTRGKFALVHIPLEDANGNSVGTVSAEIPAVSKWCEIRQTVFGWASATERWTRCNSKLNETNDSDDNNNKL